MRNGQTLQRLKSDNCKAGIEGHKDNTSQRRRFAWEFALTNSVRRRQKSRESGGQFTKELNCHLTNSHSAAASEVISFVDSLEGGAL